MSDYIRLLMNKQKKLYYEYLIAKGNMMDDKMGYILEVKRLERELKRIVVALEEIQKVELENRD